MSKGIKFFILSIIGSFLFYPIIAPLGLERQIERTLENIWLFTCLYWNTYFHTQWIKSLFKEK